MTVQVVVTTPRVDAAPGDIVEVALRLTNTSDVNASCRVSVVGLDAGDASVPGSIDDGTTSLPKALPGYDVVVAAGATVELLSPVAVPFTLGIGSHTAAIEVASDRPGDRPVLSSFVISIGSVARVDLLALPATMRGRRKTKFKLDVFNNEPVPVDLALSAEAPEVEVRFSQPTMRLQPGERALTTAKVRGPRYWSGETTQHNLVITASGRASSTSTTAAYIQRPLFAHRARMFVAALTVVALWLGAIGGVALWWSNRADEQAADDSAETVVVGEDTNGDGVIDQFTDADGNVITAIDTDGDGEPDAFFDAAGNPVPDPRTADASGAGGSDEAADGGDGSADSGGSGDGESADGEGSGSAQTSTLLRGTVKAEGDPSDIKITLTPIALGAPTDSGTPQGFVGPTRPEAAKIWSARMLPPSSATLNPIRQTEPITPREVSPEANGIWQIPNVELRHSYQIVFAKPGYNTQSFVVTPPADGSPLDLDVELQPATGAISGTVRGPKGALGGAEIVVTDGVLTFTTTSATVGDVGTWAVDQVSTPGVYTVSATLRGFGTEVRQVTLKAGEKFDAADLTMEEGVGSVSGRIIGPDGQPLGGVSITATNGDESRTTSSQTEGNIGAYNLPQLSVGGTFTLAVTAPGYLSESRRVPINGAVGGIDFGMTKTTLTLTGIVTSGTSGVGVANAGLTLTTGDLTFRASTVGGADRGRFAIDDLPPGDYTVTVDHYQHISSTQLVTLTAGITPPPLDIALERGSGLPALGTSSLVVEVVDASGKTTETRQIKNATVRLIRTQTGEELPPTTQEAFNFRIDNIPIGTYTVLVTAPRYNPAPPRLVSIGLSEQRVEVQMQRLGQASGYVIDSLTKAKLNNYFVNIYRQPESPGQTPTFSIAANTATGLWQTPVDSLVPGTYRIEIADSNSPPGYLIRTDQVLDPAVVGVGAERNMKFVLPEGSIEPVTVGSIEADPYPNITGRVYKPAMPPDSVNIIPIDSSELAVTLSCPGGTPVPAQPLDDAGTQGATPKLFDSYVITKVQVDAGNLSGDCTLDVGAGSAFKPSSIALTGVEASNGVSSSDRRVHSVLGPPPPSIGGTVYWNDGLANLAINNATVASTRATSYSVVEDPSANVPPAPIPTPGSTTSDPDGSGNGDWKLDGQIIGVAPYVFSAPNFGDGTISIKVDPTGTASATPGTGALVNPGPGGTFDVRLSAPTPRTLTGVITVQTNKTPVNFAAINITATRGAVTITEATVGPTTIVRGTPGLTTLPFSIVDAEPGQWSVSINVPAHHVEFADSIPVAQVVMPGSTPMAGFNMQLAELAELKLTLLDGAVPPVAVGTAPKITLTPVGGGATVTGTMVHTAGDPNNTFTLSDIPVSTTTPLLDKPYLMTLEVDGYDPTLINGTTVNVRAGVTTALNLTLPKFGTVSGVVNGNVDGGTAQPVNIQTEGTVVAVPTDVNGNPAPLGAPNYGATPTVTRTGNTYTISGPPGYYKVTVSHPQFKPQSDPTTVVPADNFVTPVLPGTPIASTTSGVLRIVNDRPNTPTEFRLDIIRGTLNMSVYRTLSAAPLGAVTTARYALVQGGVLVQEGPIVNGVDVTNLYPGDYTLEIREYVPGYIPLVYPPDLSQQIAFPVITSVRIARATPVPAPPGSPSTPTVTTVRAPLPPLQPSVTGSILGKNSDDRAVPLPAAATYAVTSTYDEPAVEINGTTTVPLPNQGNATATMVTTGATTAGVVSYEFANVPVGLHQVTLTVTPPSAMAGYTIGGLPYTIPKTVPLAATVGSVAGPNFEFLVPDVQLRIKFPTGDYPNITLMRLTSPGGQAKYGTGVPGTTASFDDPTDTLIFDGVAPEIGNFTLEFADALHLPLGPGVFVQVTPDLDGAPYVATDNISPLPTPGKGRLMGSATQRNTGTDNTGLQDGATITITRTTGVGNCAVPCTLTAGSSGMSLYQYDLDPGSFSVVTSQTDFQAQTVNVSVVGGAIKPQDVSISKLATFAFVFGNDPLPPGTTMVLSDGTPAVFASTIDTVGGKTRYTFKVPAQTPAGAQKNYTGTASAPGYQTLTFPSSIATYAPEIGSTTTVNPVTLAPRVFTVTVAAAAGGPAPVGTVPSGTEVIARFGGLAFPDSVAPFQFSSSDIPTLPLSGTGKAVADAPGYRANSADIPDASGPPIPITLYPLASVSGSVTKPPALAALPAGTKVIATAPGMAPIEAPVAVDVSGNGTYTLTGLDVGLNGALLPDPKLWTITYDVFGVGIGTATTTVTSATAPNPAAIVVVPQMIPVTFNISSPAPATGSIDVVFAGSTRTATPTVAGAATSPVISVPETNTTWTFTVTTPDTYLTFGIGTGTIPTPSTRAAISQPISVTARPLITGTVRTALAPAGAPVDNATVRVCPDGAPSICTGPGIQGFDDSDASGTFVIPQYVVPGNYTVWAKSTGSGTPTGFVTLIVAPDRSYTLSNSTIVVT